MMKAKTCADCGILKPETEFSKASTAHKVRRDGSIKHYIYLDSKCNECKRDHRALYMKEYRKKRYPEDNAFDQDPYKFAFKQEIVYWQKSDSKIRYQKNWKDKKDREILREGKFASI